MKMATANDKSLQDMDEHTKLDLGEVEPFAYDEHTTDVVLCVEEKKLYLSRGILMLASPVFRKMLTSNGEGKQSEISLPEESYENFVLFLKCFSPMEYVELYGFIVQYAVECEGTVTRVLPLAKKYQVASVLKKCEDWLLTEIKYLINKEIRYESERRSMVKFFAMCLLLAIKNDLTILYNRAFELLITYKLSRYSRSRYYDDLPDKNKWQLLEARMVKIEKANCILDGDY